jgi:hypothetical protein
MEQPELSDGPLIVRAYQEADMTLLFEAVRESIPEVSPWLGWCHEKLFDRGKP